MRTDGRNRDEMRALSITPGVAKYAEGSALITMGDTQVRCTASVEESVPRFRRDSGRGWVSAEYAMLPRATHTRTQREVSRGRQGGRTLEIQRLIGRSAARGGRFREVGRTHRVAGLRRDAGGRRHPHRLDQRRLRGPLRGAAAPQGPGRAWLQCR